MSPYDLILPDLGLDDRPIVLSLWLVKEGTQVTEGEPVVEVMAGEATVDLPAPADGTLVEHLVDEGEAIAVGCRLAVIRP